MRFTCRLAAALAAAVLVGCAGDGGNSARFIAGGSQTVNGATAQTYARLSGPNVKEAGVIVPFSLIQNPPAEMGSGPAGSFLDIPYPAIVQQTTAFNHYEMHWEPEGHPPPVFMVPHFDIHNYLVPESEVRAVTPPDTVAPTPDRLPAGYVYPGTNQAVPEMGVHAINPADLNPPFTKVMILGYWHGAMTFIEPMVTQEQLMSKQNFELPIAVPQTFGRATRYPTRFRAVYDARNDRYWFIFDNFVNVQ